MALIVDKHLITFNLIKAMKSGFSHSLLLLGLLSILMLPLAGLSESADLEKGITQRNLASSEARKGNYEEALKLLHQASENGDHIASWKLAGNYRGTLQGWGVKKDLRKARYYEKLAAEQGNPGAQRLINAITPWWKFWAFYGWWRFW